MRGTTYAISEIIWWMLAALAIGILIGWLLRRWYSGTARLKDVRAELEAKNVRYAELSTELGESKLKTESLNRDLEARAAELATATDRVGELEAQVGEMESEKDVATVEKDSEVASAESAATERDAKLTELESKAAGLETELKATSADLLEARTAHAECTVVAEASSGRLAGLETAIAEREERIAELETTLAAAAASESASVAERAVEPGAAMGHGAAMSHSAAMTHSADLEGLAAVEEAPVAATPPPTRFGTAGADHTDDLKVINGIGPKMEGLLNSFGIRAWDQLAALRPAEVAKVDEALEEFPGRIERDQWVQQATDLIRRFPDPANRPDRKTYLNEPPS